MRVGAALTAALTPATVLGHAGGAPWPTGPLSWGVLALVVVSLLRVLVRLGRRGGAGLGRSALFVAGLLALAGLVSGPLDSLGERLLWVHMVQHMGLMALAAPLLVLGLSPRVEAAWFRRRLLRGAVDIRLQAVLLPALLWFWHLPAAMAAALESDLVHVLMHASLFLPSVLFWIAVRHAGIPGEEGLGRVALGLFSLMLHMSLLGAVLTLGRASLYPAFAGSAAALGWSPLEDQQLAGLIMWVPTMIPYMAAGVWVTLRWLRQAEADAPLGG